MGNNEPQPEPVKAYIITVKDPTRPSDGTASLEERSQHLIAGIQALVKREKRQEELKRIYSLGNIGVVVLDCTPSLIQALAQDEAVKAHIQDISEQRIAFASPNMPNPQF